MLRLIVCIRTSYDARIFWNMNRLTGKTIGRYTVVLGRTVHGPKALQYNCANYLNLCLYLIICLAYTVLYRIHTRHPCGFMIVGTAYLLARYPGLFINFMKHRHHPPCRVKMAQYCWLSILCLFTASLSGMHFFSKFSQNLKWFSATFSHLLGEYIHNWSYNYI